MPLHFIEIPNSSLSSTEPSPCKNNCSLLYPAHIFETKSEQTKWKVPRQPCWNPDESVDSPITYGDYCHCVTQKGSLIVTRVRGSTANNWHIGVVCDYWINK